MWILLHFKRREFLKFIDHMTHAYRLSPRARLNEFGGRAKKISIDEVARSPRIGSPKSVDQDFVKNWKPWIAMVAWGSSKKIQETYFSMSKNSGFPGFPQCFGFVRTHLGHADKKPLLWAGARKTWSVYLFVVGLQNKHTCKYDCFIIYMIYYVYIYILYDTINFIIFNHTEDVLHHKCFDGGNFH